MFGVGILGFRVEGLGSGVCGSVLRASGVGFGVYFTKRYM